MAYTEEFRELIETTRDAVRELLNESECDAWTALREGYGEMRQALAADEVCAGLADRLAKLEAEKQRRAEAREARDRAVVEKEEARNEWREAKDAWRQISAAARESLLLNALGDERLLIREIAARMNAELGFSREKATCAVSDYEVRPLIKRMLRDGLLERAPETFNKTHTRYRYSRCRGLAGPIVELEQAYHDGESEAVA